MVKISWPSPCNLQSLSDDKTKFKTLTYKTIAKHDHTVYISKNENELFPLQPKRDVVDESLTLAEWIKKLV